jgi:hypothetical protein
MSNVDQVNTDFPTLTEPGETPKISSIFEISAQALGELRLWFGQNPPAINIAQLQGYTQQLRVYDRNPASVNVVNTLVETVIYSLQIAGGDLGINKTLEVMLIGDYLYNDTLGGAGDMLDIRVKFGGTTVIDHGNAAFPSLNASRVGWVHRVTISNTGAANSQVISSAGDGGFISGRTQAVTSAIDTTVAKTLQVTAQWNVASSGNSYRILYGFAKLI